MSKSDSDLAAFEKKILRAIKESARIRRRESVALHNRLYTQLESLSWLQRRLTLKGRLPPLRGWAASPDVLLQLHQHIIEARPEIVVEFGSGASTLVMGDALRQNGTGKLISLDHSKHYGSQTIATIKSEDLSDVVDVRIGELAVWNGPHMNPEDSARPSQWYPRALLHDVDDVDLVWVDGPPGGTCSYSRYPAVPALVEHLTPKAEVWLDDAARPQEKEICERWGADYKFVVHFLPAEKGLARLWRSDTSTS